MLCKELVFEHLRPSVVPVGHCRTCGGVRTLHAAPFNLWHSSLQPAHAWPQATHVPERRRTIAKAVATLAPPKMDTKSSTGSKVLVRMSVPYRVAFGEIIKVVGSGPFGNWDVMSAPRFDWTEGDIWVGNLMVDPGQFEYKVVIYNERTKAARWESSANRVLKVPEGPGTLTVSCYWNAPSTDGWFDKGKPDANVKLTGPDTASSASGRRRPPSPEPSLLLQKGWEEMLTRSGSPEPSRRGSSPQPSRGSPQPSRGTPTPSTRDGSNAVSWATGRNNGSTVRGVGLSRANKWAAALEEGLAEENAERRGLAKPVRRAMPSSISRESIESMLRERELMKERERERDSRDGKDSREREPLINWQERSPALHKDKVQEKGRSSSSSLSSSTKSSSSSSSSSASASPTSKSSSSWSQAKEEFSELTESGEKMMRNLSEMFSAKLGSPPSFPESWSDSAMVRGGLKQLRQLDSRVVIRSVRDMVSSIASMDELASFQKAASKTASSFKPALTPALSEGERLLKTEGEKILRAVGNVVSTKSPSAIRGDYIDEETLRESYKTKPALPTVTTRRPRLKSDTAAYDAQWKSASRPPTPSPAAKKPTPDPSRKIDNPKVKLELELPVNTVREDPTVLGGWAVVLAAVLTVLSTDNIKPTLVARGEAIRAALLEPMAPKVSGRTPQPARAPVTPAAKAPTSPKPAAASAAKPAAAAAPAAAKPVAVDQANK